MSRDQLQSHIRRSLSLVLGSTLIGCAPDEGGPVAHVVRDSLGISIVESSRPAWDSASALRVRPEPVLTIGAAEGDGPYLFHGILGVRRLLDGRIVVANAGTSELHFFDSQGRFLFKVGGAGEGPGEYRFMSLFWKRAGDTLMVSDLRGLSVHDSQGRYVRMIQAQSADAAGRSAPVGQLVGQLDGGILLSTAPGGQSPPPVAGQSFRGTIVFHWLAADGSYGGQLSTLPGPESWAMEVGGRIATRRAPFSSYPAWAAAGSHIYLTGGSRPEIEVWSADAVLRRIIRWSPPSLALESDHIARYREYLIGLTSNPATRQQSERFLAEVSMPTEMPATGEVTAILVDPDGGLWVERYRLPWEVDSQWYVFASNGAWMGSVRLPPGFSPHEAGLDYVLGVWRDELGVEYVHLYRLDRGDAT